MTTLSEDEMVRKFSEEIGKDNLDETITYLSEDDRDKFVSILANAIYSPPRLRTAICLCEYLENCEFACIDAIEYACGHFYRLFRNDVELGENYVRNGCYGIYLPNILSALTPEVLGEIGRNVMRELPNRVVKTDCGILLLQEWE